MSEQSRSSRKDFYFPPRLVSAECANWMRAAGPVLAASVEPERPTGGRPQVRVTIEPAETDWDRSARRLADRANSLRRAALRQSPDPIPVPRFGSTGLHQAVRNAKQKLEELAAAAAVLAAPRAPYFAQRLGLSPSVPAVEVDLGTALLHVISATEQRGDLAEAFGFECCDSEPDGYLTGEINSGAIEHHFGGTGLWRAWRGGARLETEHVLTLAEFAYDHVSRPMTWWYHSFERTDHPAGEYDSAIGKTRFQWEVNEALESASSPWVMNEGRIVHVTPQGLDLLVQRAAEADGESLSDGAGSALRHAVDLLQKRDRSREDIKSACRALWNVIEPHRSELENLGAPQKRVVAAIGEASNGWSVRHTKAGNIEVSDAHLEWLAGVIVACLPLLPELEVEPS